MRGYHHGRGVGDRAPLRFFFLFPRDGVAFGDELFLGFEAGDFVVSQAHFLWKFQSAIPASGMLAAIEQALAVRAVHRRETVDDAESFVEAGS
jgi:hypothetical protein